MSKVLLVGYNPPPLEADTKVEAAHYRTWQFLEALVADGHRICFCANSVQSDSPRPVLPGPWKDVRYRPLPLQRILGWEKELQHVHDEFDPDCIVAVNFDCALSATKLRTKSPVWMDVYGDYLTIVQVSRYRAGSDRGVRTSVALMRKVLEQGDVYSVCGRPQAHMMVGELAMAGRLNSRSFGYEFTRVVLPGCPGTTAEAPRDRLLRRRLAERGVACDAFVALWCGGYNPWTDVDTLFGGLEYAMARDSNLHYVSIGANSYEAQDNVYAKLLSMIKTSPFSARFHLLGWRPWGELADYYAESDVGLNIDSLHYETIFGTRTRLVEMLAAGLPVITSRGCELSELVASSGAGTVFESRDSAGLGRQLLRLAHDIGARRESARRALGFARNELSFANTTRPLREWVGRPQRAPDRTNNSVRERVEQLSYQARSVARQMAWAALGRSG
jgi:glycosyltransferase involved in cell wall biosynthesis